MICLVFMTKVGQLIYIYLDFRKAFDKVPHKRLMTEVRSLGIIDEVRDWIEDWLSDRKQRVIINGASSG